MLGEYFIITFKLAYIHYHVYIDQTDGEQDLDGCSQTAFHLGICL